MRQFEDYPRVISYLSKNGVENKLNIFQEIETDVGGVVWDSALLAVHYFIKNSSKWSNKNVLELGSGTGICGIVLAALGANVTVTDLPERLSLLEKNIEVNKSLLENRIETKVLDWTIHKSPENLDLLIAVDCVYYLSSIVPLIEFLKESDAKEILVVCEKRDIGEASKSQDLFFKTVPEFFELIAVPKSQLDQDYYAEDIIIVYLKRK